MVRKRRSASGQGRAAPEEAKDESKTAHSRQPHRRPHHSADAADHNRDDGAIRSSALIVVPGHQSPIMVRPGRPPVAYCCRVTRRLVGELYELACMGQVLELEVGRRPQCHVRQIAMYLCRVVLSLSYGAIGRALGRDRSTVMHACAAVEDRRDDRAYDAFVERCERCVLAVFASWEAGHGEA